ncbi:hypothetical protein AEAC466_02130 [Asticcacaulis sp. AC466]|uniref:flagellin n=1 Tax=Asticcacaulis sp. AC466 TaxID=1282362 RepID=UPI0003C3E69C|nr:flagellin [Asticcacaulis sp. AC466]ESQ86005.1 hypothetical protein AEAC466_02130 [Asticcacaulis sp. AC466]
MRISTAASWANALNNLSLAQDRQASANNQLSTQKISTDLMGYGRGSEVIASYQSSLSRTNSYLDVAQTVSDRLGSQDVAITTLGDSVTAAKDGIMSALANGSGSTVMVDLQGTFSSALSGLNYQHNGQYLFAGGNDAVPVNVSTMSQLGAAASATSVFTNGTIKKSSQIDANTTLQTGMLASDLGTQLMGIYKDIQNYNDDPTTGPFGEQLTDGQKTFLTAKSQEFNTVYNQILEQGSLNGTLQKRVENTQASLKGQSASLEQLVTNKTSADLAKAYTDLQQAQVAVQASAQVLSSLNTNSLLNLLR